MKHIDLDSALLPWRNASASQATAPTPERADAKPRLGDPDEPVADKSDISVLSQDLRRDLARANSAVEAASQAVDALLHSMADDISELTVNVAEVNGLIAGTILSARQRQFSVGVAEWIEELAMLTSKVPSLSQPFPAPPQGGGHQQTQKAMHILVADDNKINQRLAVDCLVSAGHSVDVVENGLEAIDAVRARLYDAVLMDLEMPALGGLEATAEIRALPEPVGRVPIIAFTAGGAPEGRSICMAAGMDDYMSKPFTPSALLEMVQKIGFVRPVTET